MKFQIASGEIHTLRNGKTTGPMELNDSETHPFRDPKTGWGYTAAGRVTLGRDEHPLDIIPPVKKLVPKPLDMDDNGGAPKTLHDEFLMAAIQGLAGQRHGGIELKITAAYAWADGIMKIRRERQNQKEE